MSIKYEFSCYSINDSIQCNSFKKSIMQTQLMLICVLRHLTDSCNCACPYFIVGPSIFGAHESYLEARD